MIFVLILSVAASAYLFLAGTTWLIQFVITAMTGQPTEFWPVFVMVTLFVVAYNMVFYRGASE